MTNETAFRHTPKHSHSSQSQCYERHQYLLSSSKWKKVTWLYHQIGIMDFVWRDSNLGVCRKQGRRAA